MIPSAFKFHYVDDDNDPITISQPDDMEEMFKFFDTKTPKVIVTIREGANDMLVSLDLANSIIEGQNNFTSA